MVCRALAFGLVPRQVQSLCRYNSAPLVAQTAVNSISTRMLFFVGTALLPGKPLRQFHRVVMGRNRENSFTPFRNISLGIVASERKIITE